MNLVNNFVNTGVDSPQEAFKASKDTLITSFTAANNSTVNASYKAYIVKSGENPLQPVIPLQIVVWGENDLGIGIVNQVIPAGGSLYVESSATNSIYFTVSGREIEET